MGKEYNKYIQSHWDNVIKAYEWLVGHDLVYGVGKGIAMNILTHDASKYGPAEFKPYEDYFYGERTPEVEEKFNRAWLHHIHNNPHHWEHWCIVQANGCQALEMPREYAYEMVCDWWAFSHKKGNLWEIFDWYEKNKREMLLHPNTREFVEDLLGKIRKILEAEAMK